MCLAPVIRPEGTAPKGQESIAQGLPWVSRNKRFALKGLGRCRRSGSKVWSRFSRCLVAPSGPIRVGGITQGKPWAMLSWPLRATERKRPNSIGLYDARHIQEQANPAGSLRYQAARF
jgi:hypothetical protein